MAKSSMAMSQQGWEAGKGCRNKCCTIVDAETAAAQEERIIEALLVDISKVVFTYRFSRQPLIREYLGANGDDDSLKYLQPHSPLVQWKR